MGLILGKRDLKLARHAVKCYYGLDDGDGKIDVIENFDNKMPTGGFIKDITEELKAWWPQNIGMKSKVARLSETDFIYCVNELRAKTDHRQSLQMEACTRNGWSVWHRMIHTFTS